MPIIPAFLFQLHHNDSVIKLNESIRTATLSPQQEFSQRYQSINRERPKLLPDFTSNNYEAVNNNFDQSGINLQCSCRQAENGEFVTELSTINHREDSRQDFRNNDPLKDTKEDYDEEEQYKGESTQSPQEIFKKQRHVDLQAENFEVGVMFASKPIVQAITNPFVGTMTNR